MVECDIKLFEGEFDLIINGTFSDRVDSRIKYYAASPPDYRSSYPGSALPFSTEKQAFENTPNIGTVVVDAENKFQIKLLKPNSFFNIDIRVDPCVNIIYKYRGEDKTLRIEFGDIHNKHKTIQSNPRKFPQGEDVVETQEKLLKKRKFC